jgi:hypothetical protein
VSERGVEGEALTGTEAVEGDREVVDSSCGHQCILLRVPVGVPGTTTNGLPRIRHAPRTSSCRTGLLDPDRLTRAGPSTAIPLAFILVLRERTTRWL